MLFLRLAFNTLQSQGEGGVGWAQNVAHMGEISTGLFHEKIKGRPLGKPRLGWEGNIKLGHKENIV
jgi:hypothetical protein